MVPVAAFAHEKPPILIGSDLHDNSPRFQERLTPKAPHQFRIERPGSLGMGFTPHQTKAKAGPKPRKYRPSERAGVYPTVQKREMGLNSCDERDLGCSRVDGPNAFGTALPADLLRG